MYDVLLKALGQCRHEAIAVRRMHRPRSGMVRCIDAMIDEMDAVAELITGKPAYYSRQGHDREPLRAA